MKKKVRKKKKVKKDNESGFFTNILHKKKLSMYYKLEIITPKCYIHTNSQIKRAITSIHCRLKKIKNKKLLGHSGGNPATQHGS